MSLLWRAGKAVSYAIKSKSRHGLHAPFVYALYDKVISVKHNSTETVAIEALRSVLLKDRRIISVKDFGAGKGEYSKRISDLTAKSAKRKAYAELLYRLAQHFRPATMLELGTCVGLSSAYLQQANPEGKLITLEGSPATAVLARENFEKLGLRNIQLIEGPFEETLEKVVKQATSLDFVYFDGNHREAPTWNYFNTCLEKAGENSVFIFDDIYWSKEMQQVWQRIKTHPRVTVSIDLFEIGIIFFRPALHTEHFVLWY